MGRGDYLIIGIVLVPLFLFLALIIFHEFTSKKIELNESDWRCTNTTTQTMIVPVSKVLIPQFSQICVKYERK